MAWPVGCNNKQSAFVFKRISLYYISDIGPAMKRKGRCVRVTVQRQEECNGGDGPRFSYEGGRLRLSGRLTQNLIVKVVRSVTSDERSQGLSVKLTRFQHKDERPMMFRVRSPTIPSAFEPKDGRYICLGMRRNSENGQTEGWCYGGGVM